MNDLNNTFVWTHKGCVCNELVALKQRHQLDTGMRYTSTRNLAKYLRPLLTRLFPVSEDTVINHSAGNKRKLLISAKKSLEKEPISKKDGLVKMFLKADKAHADIDELVDFGAPRCIQYRNKRYCLRLATYLHPVEAAVYKNTDISNTPIFAKSRNLTQRGQDLRAKFEHFHNPTVICIDHSKFDAHVSTQLLKLEHGFYVDCFDREHTAELRTLLNMQLNNLGCTKHRTWYKTRGTRMSGDQNTGLGNSLINYALLRDYVEYNNWKACYYIDGDDSVVIVEGDVQASPEHFAQFGMKTKIEKVTKEFREIEFCQTRPVFDGKQWRLVRNPFRLMARLPWAIRTITPKIKGKYLRSIGLCEMSLGVGLPIGQFIGDTLSKMGSGYMITGNHYRAKLEYMKPERVQLIPPSPLARMEYQMTWGISIADQLRFERTGILAPTTERIRGYGEEPYPQLH